MTQNRQLFLPVRMTLELGAVVLRTPCALSWSQDLAAHKILTIILAYLSVPMLVFRSRRFADMISVQIFTVVWRTAETCACLFVVYMAYGRAYGFGMLFNSCLCYPPGSVFANSM